MQGKGFLELVKAVPTLAAMEQTKGLLRTFLKQWGALNTVRIFLKTGSKTGHIQAIKSILSFRLEKLTPNFLVSLWEVFDGREAIISESRRYSYSDLKTRVFKLGNALQSLGLKPKDRCAELLYNGNEFFEAFFACSLIGCPMPFLNWHMHKDELVHAITTTNAKALILSSEFIPDVVNAGLKCPLFAGIKCPLIAGFTLRDFRVRGVPHPPLEKARTCLLCAFP